ncbi:MAG: acetolactate synthase small subunit [Dehalococcoidia bacterium]|nr:acetolactate synthase small subunit [Dehalococcoidia bacterium]HCV00044.1 acetolactate synthase small subunit [Dehalococcoidia bacterium]|tara:strand:+ start:2364 stop:2969 length:606 start_codon:yes stop_codon:yes gene_type:complete
MTTGNGTRQAQHTVVAIVEDKPGVLQRVAGLFRRRGFNIESLAVGPTEVEGLSRMTIIVDGASAPVEQVEKQLYKLIDVVKVSDLTHEDAITRELALLKVRCNNVNRHELLDIAGVFRADVVDMATNSLTLQVVGDEDKINGLITMCQPYGVRELSRTGTIAMTRGAKTTTVHESEPEAIARVHQSQGRRVESKELPFSSD